MTDLAVHFDDLIEIVSASGLGDIEDVTAWLAERGLCPDAIKQYGTMMVKAAEESGQPPRMWLDGLFASGLTLGIAIAESQRVGAA